MALSREHIDTDRLQFLGEKRKTVYQLRQQGVKFKEIGKRLGVSTGRAQSLYHSAKWRLEYGPHWTDGLSVRICNCLNNSNIKSRKEAIEAFTSGRLNTGASGPRNYGWQSHKELAKFLGLPEPQKQSRKIFVVKPRVIKAGKFTLRKADGKFWLDNGDGEAMETSEAKIEGLLKQFFAKEF